jgi:hypothetical protein
MPTPRREDCVSAGSGGESGEIECEGELEPEPALVLTLRWKNEWMGGWYWRLRACSAEAVGNAMMFLPDRVILSKVEVGCAACDCVQDISLVHSEINTARLR